MALIFPLIYFFLAYLVAQFYKRRGQSPYLGFLLSILLSPFFALLIGLLLGLNFSRMSFLNPKIVESPKIVRPASPPETREQRDRRIKKERMIFWVCIIGLVFMTWGIIHFINVQVSNVH